jgi:hypothetical protein
MLDTSHAEISPLNAYAESKVWNRLVTLDTSQPFRSALNDRAATYWVLQYEPPPQNILYRLVTCVTSHPSM